MTNMKELKGKSDAELAAMVEAARETIREERFKGAFGRKAGVIRAAKLTIARALTELATRNRVTK